MAPDWNAALTAVISHPLFSVGITLGVFQLAQLLYEQTRLMLFQRLQLALAVAATLGGHVGDAVEHQHGRRREPGVAGPEQFTARAGEQLLVVVRGRLGHDIQNVGIPSILRVSA